VGKLAESIRGSSLLKQGLTGTVAPSIGKKFEQLKLPSKDQVNEFFEIEVVHFQKTEIQNKELSNPCFNKELPRIDSANFPTSSLTSLLLSFPYTADNSRTPSTNCGLKLIT
jgi:hypothetical protein